ncbi:MAG: hypothetical protein D3920_09300 [Candidatus Electrothrix sp. AW2]|nr:hypothetical protein [Candidatus Electrothrix gigas]
MMKSIELYGLKDPPGRLLCEWRIRAVLPWVRGSQVIDLACGDNRLIQRLGYGTGVDIKNYGNLILFFRILLISLFPRKVSTLSSCALRYY